MSPHLICTQLLVWLEQTFVAVHPVSWVTSLRVEMRVLVLRFYENCRNVIKHFFAPWAITRSTRNCTSESSAWKEAIGTWKIKSNQETEEFHYYSLCLFQYIFPCVFLLTKSWDPVLGSKVSLQWAASGRIHWAAHFTASNKFRR